MHRTILPVVACAIALGAAPAQADGGHDRFSAKFSGFEEVGPLGSGQTGAILSAGTATLDLVLDRNSQVLTYTLDFSGLGSNVTQSHIHFGKRHVGGNLVDIQGGKDFQRWSKVVRLPLQPIHQAGKRRFLCQSCHQFVPADAASRLIAPGSTRDQPRIRYPGIPG